MSGRFRGPCSARGGRGRSPGVGADPGEGKGGGGSHLVRRAADRIASAGRADPAPGRGRTPAGAGGGKAAGTENRTWAGGGRGSPGSGISPPPRIPPFSLPAPSPGSHPCRATAPRAPATSGTQLRSRPLETRAAPAAPGPAAAITAPRGDATRPPAAGPAHHADFPPIVANSLHPAPIDGDALGSALARAPLAPPACQSLRPPLRAPPVNHSPRPFSPRRTGCPSSLRPSSLPSPAPPRAL